MDTNRVIDYAVGFGYIENSFDDWPPGYLKTSNYPSSTVYTEKGENYIASKREVLSDGESVTYALIIEVDNPVISRFDINGQGAIDIDFEKDVELVEDSGEEVNTNYNLNQLDFADDEPKITILKDADETAESDGTLLAEGGSGSIQGAGGNVRGVPGDFIGAEWILSQNEVYLLTIENKSGSDNRVSFTFGYRIEPRLNDG